MYTFIAKKASGPVLVEHVGAGVVRVGKGALLRVDMGGLKFVYAAWYSSSHPPPPHATPPPHMAVDSSSNHGSGATGPEPH